MNDIPAFPSQEISQQYANESITKGMTLRDYFAAKAMQGFIANIDTLEKYFEESEIYTRDEMSSKVSEMAYDFSDAMMKAREE